MNNRLVIVDPYRVTSNAEIMGDHLNKDIRMIRLEAGQIDRVSEVMLREDINLIVLPTDKKLIRSFQNAKENVYCLYTEYPDSTEWAKVVTDVPLAKVCECKKICDTEVELRYPEMFPHVINLLYNKTKEDGDLVLLKSIY